MVKRRSTVHMIADYKSYAQIMAPKIEIIHDEQLVLGEGPHWDHAAQVLYYVDIPESMVFKYNPKTNKITRVIVDKQNKTSVSFAVPVEGTKDKFVIGYGKKFAVLTWDGVSIDPTKVDILVEVDSGTINIFNDGKADPSGRLWSGTWEMATFKPGVSESRKGTFYSLSKDGKSAKAHFSGVGISNGLAWSADRRTFYYIDSLNWAVDGFDYNIDTGEITNRRTIFDLKKNNIKGLPDGMAIDSKDKLWFATFNGSGVHQVDPKTGTHLQFVQLPTAGITSVAWGGPNLDILYVTSASLYESIDQSDLNKSYVGRVFKITGLDACGLPGVPVKL
ncbi:regucalcin-like isoform X1 [Neodiprion virginianus]|uniref:regucalcin-like isoform X1 n=2 Tax=Neodiprion virginianus TaxID=2961670 RepID=UPI001EE6C966|nr:regucalcin-like isoform X1 [Neodiprion virginianus]